MAARQGARRHGVSAGQRRSAPGQCGGSHRGQRLVLLLQLVVGCGERLLHCVQLVVRLLQLLLQGAELLLGLQGEGRLQVSYR